MMEMNDLNKIREHIKTESPEYKKQMKIYLTGHRNNSCPPTLSIVIIIILVLVIIIVIILFIF